MRKWFGQGWIIAALLPVIPVVAALGDGIILTADGPLHVHRIQAMTLLLAKDNLWPRWVPYFHLGFGYPIFNFYPPGVFYLGGLLGQIGIGAASAFVILSALAWVIGSTGMYALAKTFLPGSAALLAAALWTYAPSRLYEVWYQGSLPQMVAAALVPWLFFALARMAFAPTRRAAALTAGLVAGVILTHIPIAFITALYAVPAAILLVGWATRHRRREFLRRLAVLAGSVLLGGGLSAIFWLPMLLELHHVGAWTDNADRQYFISYLKSTFLMPGAIFSQPRPFDVTDLTLRFPTTLGLVGGVLGLIGLGGLLWRRKIALAALLAVGLLFTLFMLTDYSLDVWLSLPFFRQLRYPERFLRLGAVLVALLGGAALSIVPKRWEMIGLAGSMSLVIAAALPLIYAPVNYARMDHLTALDEINFEEETRAWGTTSYDEFDPNWGATIPRPGAVPDAEQYIDHPLRLVVYDQDLIEQFPDLKTESLDDATLRVTTTSARPVRFRQYYYPGWQVTLDGAPVRAYAEADLGLLTVDVPAGEHVLTLRYAGTASQSAGVALTLFSLGVTLLLVRRLWTAHPPLVLAFAGGIGTESFPTPRAGSESRDSSQGRVRRRPVPEPDRPHLARWIAAVLLGVAAVNKLYVMPETHWLRYESAPDQPHYMETSVYQAFGDEYTLLGYTLQESTVSPGGWLLIDLYWQPQHAITTSYRSIVQIVNPSLTAAWAVSESSAFDVKGFVPSRFFSDSHRLEVYDSAPPYDGRLSVQMVDAATGEPLRLADGSDRLLLDPLIRIRGSGQAVPNRLKYTLGQGIQLRCADVQPQGDQVVIHLYWHVTKPVGQDLTVFVHGLDAQGAMIEQNDGPPLAGDYPSSRWRSGQNLVDRHTLSADPALAAVAVGLYSADMDRLPVTQNGAPVPDDAIVLPLEAVTCAS